MGEESKTNNFQEIIDDIGLVKMLVIFLNGFH